MDEEEIQTQEESEDTTQTENAGVQSRTTPLIDIANAAAERMENANQETARLQDAQGERDQRIALGGRSEAGQPVEKKEETPKEYNDRIDKEINDGQHDD